MIESTSHECYFLLLQTNNKKAFIKGWTMLWNSFAMWYFVFSFEYLEFFVLLLFHVELVIYLNLHFFHILDPLRCTEAWTMYLVYVSYSSFVVDYHASQQLLASSFTWQTIKELWYGVLWQNYLWSITCLAYIRGK